MPCRRCGAETSQGSSKCLTCAKQEFYGSSAVQVQKESNAGYRIIALGIAVIFFIILGVFYSLRSTEGDSPSVAEVESKMREYLASTIGCSDQLFFDSFEIVKIGDYKKGDAPFVINGWPIYIVAKVRCQSGGRSVTNNFKGDAPTAYVRKGVLGYEVFIPEILDSMQKDFQRRIDRAVGRM